MVKEVEHIQKYEVLDIVKKQEQNINDDGIDKYWKSTTGYLIKVFGTPVIWKTKKKYCDIVQDRRRIRRPC